MSGGLVRRDTCEGGEHAGGVRGRGAFVEAGGSDQPATWVADCRPRLADNNLSAPWGRDQYEGAFRRQPKLNTIAAGIITTCPLY